jgi:hypothetical protein
VLLGTILLRRAALWRHDCSRIYPEPTMQNISPPSSRRLIVVGRDERLAWAIANGLFGIAGWLSSQACQCGHQQGTFEPCDGRQPSEG